jgi:hypothetical protein
LRQAHPWLAEAKVDLGGQNVTIEVGAVEGGG